MLLVKRKRKMKMLEVIVYIVHDNEQWKQNADIETVDGNCCWKYVISARKHCSARSCLERFLSYPLLSLPGEIYFLCLCLWEDDPSLMFLWSRERTCTWRTEEASHHSICAVRWLLRSLNILFFLWTSWYQFWNKNRRDTRQGVKGYNTSWKKRKTMDCISKERRQNTHARTFSISNMWQGLGPAQWLSDSLLCQLVRLGGYDVSTRFDKIRDSAFSGNCQNIRTPRFCPPQPWLKVWTITICGMPTSECLFCAWQI